MLIALYLACVALFAVALLAAWWWLDARATRKANARPVADSERLRAENARLGKANEDLRTTNSALRLKLGDVFSMNVGGVTVYDLWLWQKGTAPDSPDAPVIDLASRRRA